jgi:hypothetical protein
LAELAWPGTGFDAPSILGVGARVGCAGMRAVAGMAGLRNNWIKTSAQARHFSLSFYGKPALSRWRGRLVLRADP